MSNYINALPEIKEATRNHVLSMIKYAWAVSELKPLAWTNPLILKNIESFTARGETDMGCAVAALAVLEAFTVEDVAPLVTKYAWSNVFDEVPADDYNGWLMNLEARVIRNNEEIMNILNPLKQKYHNRDEVVRAGLTTYRLLEQEAYLDEFHGIDLIGDIAENEGTYLLKKELAMAIKLEEFGDADELKKEIDRLEAA